LNPYTGVDCSLNATNDAVELFPNIVVYATVQLGWWNYYYYPLPGSIGEQDLTFDIVDSLGRAEIYLSYDSAPTFNSFGVGVEYTQIGVRVVNITAGILYIGIYGREAADYSLVIAPNCGSNSIYVNTTNVCQCSDICYNGAPSCSNETCASGCPCHTAAQQQSSTGGSSSGAIGIIVVVIIILVIIAVGAIVVFVARRRRQRSALTVDLPGADRSAPPSSSSSSSRAISGSKPRGKFNKFEDEESREMELS